MKQIRIFAAALMLLLFFSPLHASSSVQVPQRPAVEGPVNDYAGILTPSQVRELQHLLIDFADSTSNQICVVTVPDLGDYSASEFAIQIGLNWNVGSSEFNNGVVFLVKPKPADGNGYGDAFIAVGRGLEGAIPDAYCTRIITRIAVPYFAQNDYYAGIRESCLKLMALAGGEYSESARDSDEDIWINIFAVVAGIAFALAIFIIIFMLIGKGRGNNNGGGRNGGDFHRGIIWGNTVSPRGGNVGGFGGFSGGGFSGGFRGGFGGGSFGGGGGGGRW